MKPFSRKSSNLAAHLSLAILARGQLMVQSPTKDQSANIFRFVQGAFAEGSALRR
jgi:hypothetical protein